MTERPKATTEWLKDLDDRRRPVDGPAPVAVKAAAVICVLATPFMAYLTVGFVADVWDFATRGGPLLFVQIIGYGLVAVLVGGLTVACPVAARQLLRDGDPKLAARMGLLVGGLLAFTLGLSVASNGTADPGLFSQLGSAMLLAFGLVWLVRRRQSAQWLQGRRHELRKASGPAR